MDAKLHDEAGRIAAVRRYEILDTPREAPFDRITNLVRTVLDVPISTVSLIDSDRQWYKSCVGMESTDLPRQFSFCTHTIQSREPLVIPDTLSDDRFAHYPGVMGEPHIRSYAGVPLASPDGYNLGSLCALDRRPRDFSAGQIDVLKSFAALVVDELELRRIAQVDSLTEAATRRSFLLEMEKTIAKIRRHGTPASLLVLDIDYFKRINDVHGHGTGDMVLQQVGKTLGSLMRKEDLLGRLGGEEFGVLLGGNSLDEASDTAERLRQAIESHFMSGDAPLGVTASFGISSLEPHETTPENWLARTDLALYAAKRNGRNRCCIAAPEEQLAAVAL